MLCILFRLFLLTPICAINATESHSDQNQSIGLNIFSGIVAPRSKYQITVNHYFGTIKVESDEEGEFEADLGPKVTEEEEIRIEISKDNGQMVRMWTVAWLGTNLVHRFHFGITEGPTVLNWKFTNFGELLKPNVQYRWSFWHMKASTAGTMIGEENFQIQQNQKEVKLQAKVTVDSTKISDDDEWQIWIHTREETNIKEHFINPEESCPICLEVFTSVDDAWRPEQCNNHIAHKRDLEDWFGSRRHDRCPICGVKVNKKIKKANSAEDNNLIKRTSDLLDRIVRKFSIPNPVLSSDQSADSWPKYHFVYEFDCSIEMNTQLDPDTHQQNKKHKIFDYQWVKVFFDNIWTQGIFAKKHAVYPESVTVETRMEHWVKSAESDRMLMEVISSHGEAIGKQVKLSSGALEKFFTILLSFIQKHIIKMEEEGMFGCKAQKPKLEISQFDKNAIEENIKAEEVFKSIRNKKLAAINLVAVKKLFALAIRMSLIIGNNPQRLQTLVAAYKCITLPGHDNLFRTHKVLEGDENNFWMSEVINKSIVLANIQPFILDKTIVEVPVINESGQSLKMTAIFDLGLNINWDNGNLANRYPIDFVAEYFGMELSPMEILCLQEQILDNLANNRLLNDNKRYGPMIERLLNRLDTQWATNGSFECSALLFCQGIMHNFKKTLEEQLRRYDYKIKSENDRIKRLTMSRCPTMWTVQHTYNDSPKYEEQLLEIKRLPHIEDILKIEWKSQKIWMEFFDAINEASNSAIMGNKSFEKEMYLYRMEFLISLIPQKLQNEFILEPLAWYDQSIENTVAELVEELQSSDTKNIVQYFKNLIGQIRKENNHKKCRELSEKFDSLWAKLLQIIKIVAKHKLTD